MSILNKSSVRFRTAVAGSERAGLALFTLAVLGFYWLVRAPVLNPSGYIDPWIYTAAFKNYGFLIRSFPGTYYLSRLPWIIPGIAVNSVLSPVPAFFVLHLVFFLTGGLFAFLLLRRYCGPTAAFLGYAALVLSPVFYNAYSNDYPDGALVTYLLGGAYFALGALNSSRRGLRLALAGFFLAAAVATNLFTGIFVVGLAIAYVVIFPTEPGFIRSLARDAAGFAFGAVALLLGCGIFSRLHGGGFLFFMPSVRAIGSLNGADYKADGYGWLKGEPQLLLPPFGLAALAVLIPMRAVRRLRSDETLRFAIGAGAFLTFTFVYVCVWEFVYGGNLLETPYYFSLFNVPLAFVVGSILFVVSRPIAEAGAQMKVLIVAAVAAFALPTFVTYRIERGFIAQRPAVTLVLMAASLAFLTGARFSSMRGAASAIAGVAVVLSMFTVGYAASTGTTTQSVFNSNLRIQTVGAVQPGHRGKLVESTYSERRQTLSLAIQLIRFMQQSKLQSAVPGYPMTSAAPAFWYNGRADIAFTGMQSTYLWAYTWVGLDMPKIDRPMRTLLHSRRPRHLVLLCLRHACGGASDALERAGYPNTLFAERRLVSGDKSVWVRALALTKFRAEDPFSAYYERAQSPFAKTADGPPMESWSFVRGAPTGWSGSAVDALNTASNGSFETSSRQWDYELVSPQIALEPGRYRVYLSGAVSAGGLDLGVLDAQANTWIAQRFYWFRQRGFDTWMTTPFQLREKRDVRVVLSNWVPHEMVSRWSVEQVRIVRAP